MYQAGDTVVHPSEGLCTVEAVRALRFAGGEPREYYVLKPVADKSSSTVYLPVERGDAVLRRVLSRQDVVDMIHRSAQCDGLWIADSRQRRDAFQSILAGDDYPKLIRVIALLHEESDRRASEGKKPCASDERLREQAEERVHQEFSYVLHMDRAATIDFIRRELGVAAAQ